MLEDENINSYIASMNKIIASGNPKYLSYVCKEYMNAKKNNPVLTMILENMIRKEATDQDSVYAILIDSDNGINLDAMSDISKITNTADFMKNIDALSGQDVDFGDLTSDELIIEGMQIAEEIAREIDELENNIDYEDEVQSEKVEASVDIKTENVLGKITLFGAVAISLQKIIGNIKNKLGLTKNKVREKINDKREMKKKQKLDEKQKKFEDANLDSKKEKVNNFIPKVDIDEEAVIRKMKEGKIHNIGTKKREITSETSTEDDSFNNTSDEDDTNNNTQEDDEPDI